GAGGLGHRHHRGSDRHRGGRAAPRRRGVRQFERLERIYQDGDTEVRRLALHQMENDALDFEADDCLTFLEAVASREAPALAAQARRTLRRLMPQWYALRYRLRQPT